MSYELFGRFADLYDWHTPPHHYQNDHSFVLGRLRDFHRILDIGCGTGVFLKKAIDLGFDAYGIDASKEMVNIAKERVGNHRVRTLWMQNLGNAETFDGIVSLCWSFNYARSFMEAHKILENCFNSLNPGGMLILQVAHAPNATGKLNEDREKGPMGDENDIVFLYRFSQIRGQPNSMSAQYVYGCKSREELIFEEHILPVANVENIALLASKVGFKDIELLDSCFEEQFSKSFNVFLIARRP